MTKGAIAMVVAKAYPEATKTKRSGSSAGEQRFPMVAKSKLSEARAVVALASYSRPGSGGAATSPIGLL